MGQRNADDTQGSLPPYKPSGSNLVQQMELEFPAEVDEPPARAAWGGKLEFILTCVGFAVGLGNVWRFPYLCYKNGGGAFLIPYISMLALVGLPIFFMEISFGQFASRGPIAIWTINPLLKGLGYTMVIANTLVAIYYNVIIAWCMHYFFASMTSSLPWEHCNNAWNTEACYIEDSTNSSNATLFHGMTNNYTFNHSLTKTPSEEYFYNQVLNISSGISEFGEMRWPLAACLAAAWVLVFVVLIKGISSLGKVVYFSSTFPYVLLTVMLVRGVTLPGAIDGIMFYITPDFSRLTDAQVWSDAAVQIFYSLSTCTGGLVAMASYNKFNNNCLRDSLLVPLINCGTSLYAGFVIFAVLGFMAQEKGVPVADVAASGPGLVFVVYPEGLTQMPLSPLWAVMFFFMMMTLGFSSQFSMVECFFSAVSDELVGWLGAGGRRVILFRAFFCCVFCAIGLTMTTQGGFYMFYLADNYVGGFPLLVVGLMECVALQHIYGFDNFANDIELMLGRKPNIYFKITWVFVTPAILLAIIVFKAVQYERLTLFQSYIYPDWSMSFAWLLVIGPMAFIPAVYLYRYMQEGGYQLTLKLLSPTAHWGPALAEDRTGVYASVANKPSFLTSVSNTYVDVDTTPATCDNAKNGVSNPACSAEEM